MSQYAPTVPLPHLSDARVAIVMADWNGHITSELTQGAVDTLLKNGFSKEDVVVMHVPGTVELTFGASQLIESSLFDAVIVVGCVIRGDTPHFDYVCQSVTQGVTHLNAECDIPVIFCVLTVNDEQQALDRAGGPAGHKGVEAAQAAIHMIDFKRQVLNM
ncbi:MAG: 6,7-dimethyl-8-ribityllumazine synthase [Bacteroidales bacterium]|nr:6,7-dimethyl-8-ribityllumazine synthase [Bacteroidales bacterium]